MNFMYGPLILVVVIQTRSWTHILLSLLISTQHEPVFLFDDQLVFFIGSLVYRGTPDEKSKLAFHMFCPIHEHWSFVNNIILYCWRWQVLPINGFVIWQFAFYLRYFSKVLLADALSLLFVIKMDIWCFVKVSHFGHLDCILRVRFLFVNNYTLLFHE